MLTTSIPFVNGIPKFPFETSFRKWIIVTELALSDIEDIEKTELIFNVLGIVPKSEKDIHNKLRKIKDFQNCGNKFKIKTSKADGERAYSFYYDWSLIYSAFFEQYQIDLFEVDLHWWKFIALLNGLHNTKFNDVIGYRLMDLGQIKNNAQKEHYRALKRMYAIPKIQSKEDKELLNMFNQL